MDAARALAAMGYTDVRDYRGGKEDWVAAGLELEK
jgi:rhodanese-related sulfurtransferase